MRKIVAFVWTLMSASGSALAQPVVDFTVQTPFIEPNGGTKTIPLSDGEFLTLGKKKGTRSGGGTYVLTRHYDEMHPVWQTEIELDASQEMREMHLNAATAVVFINGFDTDKQTASLEARAFAVNSGAPAWTKEVHQGPVGTPESSARKGIARATFEEACLARLNEGMAAPPAYRYEIRFSPDGSKVLTYHYDYAQPSLAVEAFVYQASDLKQLGRMFTGIGSSTVNYGLTVTDAGDIITANTSPDGSVSLIRHALADGTNKVLSLGSSNYQREYLRWFETETGQTELWALNYAGTEMAGFLRVRFDFDKGEIETPTYWPLSAELKQAADRARVEQRGFDGPEDWEHFDLAYAWPTADGGAVLALENRELFGTGFSYQGPGARSPEAWDARKLQAKTGGIALVAFGPGQELKWERYQPKAQQVSAQDGLNAISFVADYRDDQLQLAYAESPVAGAPAAGLRYLSISAEDGQAIADARLDSEERLQFLRDYAFFTNDGKLIIAGRKGILGKSSKMTMHYLPAPSMISQSDF